MELEFIKELE